MTEDQREKAYERRSSNFSYVPIEGKKVPGDLVETFKMVNCLKHIRLE